MGHQVARLTINDASGALVTNRFSDALTKANQAFSTAISALSRLAGFEFKTTELDTLFPTNQPTLTSIQVTRPDTALGKLVSPAISLDVSPNITASLIVSKKIQDILGGATVLNPTAEQNIWDREKERAELELQRSKDRITTEWASNGFTLPDGVLTSAILDIETKYNDAKLTSSRDIAFKVAEMAFNGVIVAMQSGIGEDTNIINLGIAKADMDLRVAVEASRLLIADFDGKLKQLDAEVKIFMAKTEMYKTDIQAKQALDEITVRVFESGVNQTVAETTFELKKAELNILQTIEATKLLVENIKAVAQVAAQLAASSLSGVSASAHIGSSSSLGIDNNLSEQHFEDETKI